MNATRAHRDRPEAIISDRSAPQKQVWRANIILTKADGCGTAEIMRRSGKSKLVAMAGAAFPRWTFHFTPTSASRLNAVKGFFAKPTRQRLQHGVFRSVVDLQLAINHFVADTNADPKPFAWTADPKRVLAAVKRGKQTLD